MMWELALLPPVARFFVGLLLVVIVIGIEVLFAFWIYSQYGKED
jgi:hypothetical protein